MRVIGILGAERSGKSTLAKALKAYGFKTVTLAEPLKKMLAAGLDLTEAQLYGDLKETPTSKLNGRTPRHAMQTLGTEWGRQMLDDDIWCDKCERDLRQAEFQSPGGRYVFEDIRFPNEIAMVKRLGGELWLVRRPDVEPGFTLRDKLSRLLRGKRLHASQTEWARMATPDATLWNTSSSESYVLLIETHISSWLRRDALKEGRRVAPEPVYMESAPYDALRTDAPYALDDSDAVVQVTTLELDSVPGPTVSATIDVLLGESDGAHDPGIDLPRNPAKVAIERAEEALLADVIAADLAGESLAKEEPKEIVPLAQTMDDFPVAGALREDLVTEIAKPIADPAPGKVGAAKQARANANRPRSKKKRG